MLIVLVWRLPYPTHRAVSIPHIACLSETATPFPSKAFSTSLTRQLFILNWPFPSLTALTKARLGQTEAGCHLPLSRAMGEDAFHCEHNWGWATSRKQNVRAGKDGGGPHSLLSSHCTKHCQSLQILPSEIPPRTLASS